jgi:hypothetical protein
VLADGYAVRVGGELRPGRYGDRGEVVAAVMRVARGGVPAPATAGAPDAPAGARVG